MTLGVIIFLIISLVITLIIGIAKKARMVIVASSFGLLMVIMFTIGFLMTV